LHEKIATIFGPNVVGISTHNTKVFLTCNDVGDGHVGPLSTKEFILNLAPTMMAAIPLSSNSHGIDCKLRIQNL
jgi:hypothetical protein